MSQTGRSQTMTVLRWVNGYIATSKSSMHIDMHNRKHRCHVDLQLFYMCCQSSSKTSQTKFGNTFVLSPWCLTKSWARSSMTPSSAATHPTCSSRSNISWPLHSIGLAISEIGVALGGVVVGTVLLCMRHVMTAVLQKQFWDKAVWR